MKTAFSHVLPCMLAGIMLSSAPDFSSAQEIPADSKEAAAEKADSYSYPALTSDVFSVSLRLKLPCSVISQDPPSSR
jgi:hypothetical protein